VRWPVIWILIILAQQASKQSSATSGDSSCPGRGAASPGGASSTLPAPHPLHPICPDLCRQWILPAWMATELWLIPSQRSVGVGTALVLERQPSEGIQGAALDVLRALTGGVIALRCGTLGFHAVHVRAQPFTSPRRSASHCWFLLLLVPAARCDKSHQPPACVPCGVVVHPPAGTRCLAWTVWSVFMPLPPTATLAARAAVVYFTGNAPAYCSTPLLSGPLAQGRQVVTAQVLELAYLPLVAVQPGPSHFFTAPHLLAGESACQGSAHGNCRQDTVCAHECRQLA